MYSKIYSTLLVCLIFCVGSKAQIAKNSVLLGGQLSFNSSSYETTDVPGQKVNNALISIRAGKAFKENWIGGVKLLYGPSTTKWKENDVEMKNTSNRLGGGLFVRNYKKLAKDFYFFAELGADYLFTKGENLSDGNKTNETRQSWVGLGLTPGISYRIYKKMYAELLIQSLVSLQYSHYKQTNNSGDSKTDSFSFNTNLNISSGSPLSVGLHFII